MKSHTYTFGLKELARLLGLPLGTLLIFAMVMHGAKRLGWLPEERATLDMEKIVVERQIKASRSWNAADLLLIGDSTCLMDFTTDELERDTLPRRAYDLGTFSPRGLTGFAALLRDYATTNAPRLRTVVLLVCPEMLRSIDYPPPSPPTPRHPIPPAIKAQMRELQEAAERMKRRLERSWLDEAAPWIGLDVFKSRVLNRLLESPLFGSDGQFYGFPAGLRDYMHQHHGSVVLTYEESEHKGGSPPFIAPYFVSEGFKLQCKFFREAVPSNVSLFVGITPADRNRVQSDYPQTYRQMLEELSKVLHPDVVLTNLPPTMPSHLFADVMHLNELGAREYTRRLAKSLKPHL